MKNARCAAAAGHKTTQRRRRPPVRRRTALTSHVTGIRPCPLAAYCQKRGKLQTTQEIYCGIARLVQYSDIADLTVSVRAHTRIGSYRPSGLSHRSDLPLPTE